MLDDDEYLDFFTIGGLETSEDVISKRRWKMGVMASPPLPCHHESAAGHFRPPIVGSGQGTSGRENA